MLNLTPILRGAAAAALSLGLAVSAQAQDGPMGDGGTIRLLTNPAGTMSFPPFVIEKFNLDEKYGFTLESVPYTDENSIVAALQGGGADGAMIDWLLVARLRQNGIPILGALPFLTFVNSVLVPADDPAESLADLEDYRFGVHSRAAFDWLMIQAAAKKNHDIDMAEFVQLHEAAVPLLRGLMDQDQLDATQMWNSLAAGMLSSGEYKTLVTIRELSEEMGFGAVPYLMYAFREDFMEENKQNMEALAAVYAEVVDILMTDDSVWEERGAQMDMTPEAIVAFRDQVRRDIVKSFSEEDEESFYAMFDTLKETAGVEVLGMEEMPDDLLTTEFQD